MIKKGYTLIEMLIVVAIIGILASILMVIINPARQLAKARDSQRQSDLFAILSAVYQYTTEHSGELPDTDGDPETSNFPTSLTCIGSGVSCFDLSSSGDGGETIVPVYMGGIPYDPSTGDNSNTQYSIYVDEYKRLHASASGEVSGAITIDR